MIEDLRKQVDEAPKAVPRKKRRPSPERRFLGMTPAQRFTIALMLLMMVCLVSVLCLVLTGKIVW